MEVCDGFSEMQLTNQAQTSQAGFSGPHTFKITPESLFASEICSCDKRSFSWRCTLTSRQKK